MSFGTAMHRAIEANNRYKAEHQEDMPADDVQEVWAQAWNEAAEQTAFEDGENAGEIKDEGVRALELYMQEIAPTISPILIEHVFEIGLDDSYTLKGIIDCVDQNNLIIDNKTTKRTPSGDPTQGNLQLVAYAIAHREILGITESGVRLDYIVRTKTPKVISFSGGPCDDLAIKRGLKLISATARAIRLGVYMPNPNNFTCSSTGCGYWDICHDQW
jgi:RecB family exonuclease